MKKALIASTALVLTAGVAAADVTISGYGRTGVQYQENRSGGAEETQIISRLRMNIDAKTSTDQGVDFGARFRIQWDQNSDDAGKLNAGKLWVTSSGLTVEVGNVDTAFDSAGLIYATDLGAFDTSKVNKMGDFFAYAAEEYSSSTYVGVRAVYEFGDLTVQASYIDPDQTGLVSDNEELGFAADYTWNDRLELSFAAVQDGEGVADNDQYFIGARYAVMENARIGLSYYSSEDWSAGDTILLFGDYTLADGLTNIEAQIGNNNQPGNVTDNAFGIGVNYDLGGARLGASLQRDYNENIYADMGVRFNF